MEKETNLQKITALERSIGSDFVLVSQGDEPKALYIVINGRFDIYRNGIKIAEINKRGDYIGEISALMNSTHSATVKSKSPSTVLEIKLNNIQSFFSHSPEMAISLARKLSERLVEVNKKFAQIINKPKVINSLILERSKLQNPKSMVKVDPIDLKSLKSLYVEALENVEIIRQGHPPDALYILVDGEVEIIKNGKKIAIESKPGYYLGDVSVLRKSAANATVKTTKKSILIEIKADKVDNFLYHSPEIPISIARKLAERILNINDTYLDFLVDELNHQSKKKELNPKHQIDKMKEKIKGLLEFESSDV
ncbi:MAG: cyclic nucleotide-binding domain-containing protein [Leptospiraceae bacterium]|nr:cyclic nucleotide-binding domain-containing protein [Leptospiraceae bacterium]MCP5497407.1 cyclic nucleotide-binding domain-containing protein [Leptospiraceae bacterium]